MGNSKWLTMLYSSKVFKANIKTKTKKIINKKSSITQRAGQYLMQNRFHKSTGYHLFSAINRNENLKSNQILPIINMQYNHKSVIDSFS